jgi:pimeloyl-ACP methyl ester carboxylesterase
MRQVLKTTLPRGRSSIRRHSTSTRRHRPNSRRSSPDHWTGSRPASSCDRMRLRRRTTRIHIWRASCLRYSMMRTQANIRRQSVIIDGHNVSYLDSDHSHGRPTLVFVHGSGMSARYWSDQLRALEGTARVLAIDLPGHGESDDAATPGLALYADVTAAVLDALGAWPAIAIGHSLGGAVAITLAARRPDEVSGLVLLSACARLPPVSTPIQWLWGSLPPTLRRVLFFVTAKNLLFAAGASPAAVALGMQELHACRPHTLAADVAIARSVDLTHVAGALRVPTLILCGSRDRITPADLSRHLHASITGSALQIVEGAGHMLLIEASAVVNCAIAAFAAALMQRSPAPGGMDGGALAPWPTRWRHAVRRLVALVRRR